ASRVRVDPGVNRYCADCEFRGVPFIHVETHGKLAYIWWELRWLELRGNEVMSHKLTPLGIQLDQLFSRCKLDWSQGSVGGDAGYFEGIPAEYAMKVASELYAIFKSFMRVSKSGTP
ncbi:MAG TPA: hypothetical protein VN699_01515, partial [Pirellulales bacterium]|nr:hypothetical protein [Pirellulales bacterium]